MKDFELTGTASGSAYVNAEADPSRSTIEIQIGRAFRSLTFPQAAALGAWLLEATGEVQ